MCNFKPMSGSSSDDDDDNDDGESNIEMSDSSVPDSEPEYDETGAGPSTSQGRNESKKDDDEEDEDEVIKAIRMAKEKGRENPPDISLSELVSDVSFHPGDELLAVGLGSGDVCLYKYSLEENILQETWELHTKSCRAVEFSDDGCMLFSCGSDKSVMLTDIATGTLKQFYDGAHDNPIYSLYVFDDNVFCTGDEDGVVKVWDVRQKTCVTSFNKMEDTVNAMTTTSSRAFLVCASGDGCLTSFDMNTRQMFLQSEEYESDLNCLGLFKQETKLLVGSSTGKMYLFNWGEFGYHSDEYGSLKKSVNAIVPITENIVAAGYEDGIIRAAHVFPQRQLGVVGQHNMSIEAMDISHDGSYIASASADGVIKFWNIRYFEDVHVDKKKVKDKKKDLAHNLPSSKAKNTSDFFSDL